MNYNRSSPTTRLIRPAINLFLAWTIALLPLSVLAKEALAQKKGPILESFELRDDFQGDSLGQWASYPPAQDVGYEPSLSPTTDYGSPSGRALMRVVKPNRAGPQRFGFIKQVRFRVATDSRFNLAYQLKSLGDAAQIELGLAATNGTLYTKKFSVKTNQWSIAMSSLAETDAPVGAEIEAVYIVAELTNADPDFIYRFMMYSVMLSGVREARFHVDMPSSAPIEPWSSFISTQSYRHGDTIKLAARLHTQLTEQPRLTEAECILETQTGQAITTARLYNDGSHGDKIAGDDIWTNDQAYQLRTSDPSGIWLARLRGTTSIGQTIITDIRLVVRTDDDRNHPRLFFSAGDREKLIARTRDPKLAGLWTNLQTTANNARATGNLADGGKIFELLDSEYLLPSLLGYFDVLNRARSRIAHNALEAYITGSEEARTAAKTAMLDVAHWPRWEPPWFRAHGQHTYYPAGLLAADVAFGYDLLYDDLSEPERVLIRQALIEKSISPTFKEYVADNRIMANTSNWIAHTVGGALIAAASIANDLSEKEREGAFEFYVGGLMRKLEDHMAASYLSDGSYGEGISYHEFDAETLGPALVAVKRAFGANYWKQTHVLESFTYPLYTLVQPLSATPDMGDTHPPAGHGIPAIVYHSKDPVARWYYSQFDRPSLAKFIFYDDSVPSEPPKLPTSRIFHDKGNAVFRSGWAGDDLVMLFRAGPNFNHHHADQGSFLLSGFGEILVSEAGWSDYYKDPYYATFFTQAVGHNIVLVGSNPESQTIADTPQFKALDSYPRITDSLTSTFHDAVGSELSSVYQGRLARYVRRIVFVKPSYFVVFDDLKTSGNLEQFDFLLHLPNRDRVKIDDQTAIYNSGKASLAIRFFPSTASKLSVEKGRIPYHIFAARTPAEMPALPAYLDFKTVKQLNQTQFLAAIVPAKTEVTAQGLIKEMTKLDGDNFKGIRVHRGAKTDLVMFRMGGEAQTFRQGEWAVDAATLTMTHNADTLEVFAVQSARLLRRGNQTLFSTESPISLAARFGTNEVEVVGNAQAATRIRLYVGKSPVRVLLDDKDVSATAFSFNRSEGTMSFVIPSGQHNLTIMFR